MVFVILIDRLREFCKKSNENIKKISRHDRGKDYWIERKKLTDEEIKSIYGKNQPERYEEWFAKYLVDMDDEYNYLGEIINYQIPIKSKQDDGAGKIDLLSYNKKSGILYLIELKQRENKTDTMLRSILEICTYYYQIDREQLKKELLEKNICPTIENIQKVVIVFKNSVQHKQYIESELIRKLADELNVAVFIIENKVSINKVE